MSDTSIQATAVETTPILRTVEVEVGADRVDEAFEKAYKDLAKSTQLNGFRRGKVPRSVLLRVYGPQVAEQLEQTLIQETIAAALKTAEVEAVAPPAVDSSPPEPGASFSYVAHVEVRPSIELPELEGLPGKRPAADVADEEIEKELESLRERNAPVIEEPEGTEAENGHILTVDFVGKVDGELFEGGSGRDVEIELGAGRFIPGFEEQLVGARSEDDVEVNVTFPEDYQSEQLAGKEARFAVHVAEVKKKQLPELDDEFAKDLGEFDTLAELRERVAKDLGEMKERNAKNALYRSLLEELVERTEFEVPHGMIDRQLQRRLDGMHRQMHGQMDHDTLHEELDRMRDQWRPIAEREVREQLLMEAVANQQGFEPSEDEVAERVERMAQEQGVDAETLQKALGEGAAESLALGQVRDEKALDFLASVAKVEEISDS
jgi:trigger factor